MLYLQEKIIGQVIWGPQNSLLKAGVMDPGDSNTIYQPLRFYFFFACVCGVLVCIWHTSKQLLPKDVSEKTEEAAWSD